MIARAELTAPDDLPEQIAGGGFTWLPVSAQHGLRRKLRW
jgi:hypothetical protein